MTDGAGTDGAGTDGAGTDGPRFDSTLGFETGLSPDLADGASPLLARRATLELPFALRIFAMRTTMMLGTCGLSRTPHLVDRSKAAMERSMSSYDATASALRRPRVALSGHPACAALLETAMARCPGVLDAVAEMQRQILALIDKARRDGTVSPEDYDLHIAHATEVFTPAVMDLGSVLATLDAEDRTRRDESVRDARADVVSACGEIERIARTVRIISLNAAVEAARAGEAGAGFGVIATEIRDLSEKTRISSGRIGESLERIVRHRLTG